MVQSPPAAWGQEAFLGQSLQSRDSGTPQDPVRPYTVMAIHYKAPGHVSVDGEMPRGRYKVIPCTPTSSNWILALSGTRVRTSLFCSMEVFALTTLSLKAWIGKGESNPRPGKGTCWCVRVSVCVHLLVAI